MSRLSISKPQAEDDDEHLYFLNEIPSSLDRALNISSKAPHSHFVAIASPRGSSSSSSASSSSLSPRHPARASLATSRRYAPLFNPIKSFYRRHEAPILVITSQLFGAGMNVVTRLLENEDEGMQAFQVLFVRMFITVCGCLAWGYWAKLPDFPLGKRGMRKWLFARAATGFWGIFGMYCGCFFSFVLIFPRCLLWEERVAGNPCGSGEASVSILSSFEFTSNFVAHPTPCSHAQFFTSPYRRPTR